MFWRSLVAVALCLVLANAIAFLLFYRKATLRRLPYFLVSLLLFFLFSRVYFLAFLPHLRERETDRQLRELPFYRDLAEVDPQTYERVMAVVSESAKKGETTNRLSSEIAPIVEGTLSKYIGTASDESVIAFADLSIHEVEELHRSHSDACYDYLYPQDKGATPAASYIDEKSEDETLDVLSRIVHSAAHTPQPLPNAAKADALLAPVLNRLASDYGNDLMLIHQKPTAPAEREKVCDIVVSLFKNLKALPREDASLVLRNLLSEQGAKSKTEPPRR